jgi:hypothetical protein
MNILTFNIMATTLETIILSTKKLESLINEGVTSVLYKNDIAIITTDKSQALEHHFSVVLKENELEQLRKFKKTIVTKKSVEIVIKDKDVEFIEKIKNDTAKC